MVMPLSGTFRYRTIVPERGAQAAPWEMESAEAFSATGNPLSENRLVGWNPSLHISDAGVTPNLGPRRPAVLRSELRLVATGKKYASRETASYFVDQALVSALQPGDIFHMARTHTGGVGLPAIRQGKLIFAVGEVSAVPLGEGIHVRTPFDLCDRAREIFLQRDSQFEFSELPVEVRIGEELSILFRGELNKNGYQVSIVHGFRPGLPGEPECVAIALDGACNHSAANASALLLESREA